MDRDISISRGCFFCKGGKEREVVQKFNSAFPGDKAIAPTRTRYRRNKDSAIEETVLLLPSYVFFQIEGLESPSPDENRRCTEEVESALQLFCRNDSVLRLLKYTDGNWRLHGADDQFAEMLFKANGNIGVSQAYFDEGKRIRITEGFLKDYEGSIIRVNRKTKTVEVSVDFQDKKVNMWLGYEMTEKIES